MCVVIDDHCRLASSEIPAGEDAHRGADLLARVLGVLATQDIIGINGEMVDSARSSRKVVVFRRVHHGRGITHSFISPFCLWPHGRLKEQTTPLGAGGSADRLSSPSSTEKQHLRVFPAAEVDRPPRTINHRDATSVAVPPIAARGIDDARSRHVELPNSHYKPEREF